MHSTNAGVHAHWHAGVVIAANFPACEGFQLNRSKWDGRKRYRISSQTRDFELP
jgi:hypothetical protein